MLTVGRTEPHELPAASEAAPTSPKKPTSRDSKKFIGFYADLDLTERLRDLAFEIRREKQDLMIEALEML